MHREAEPCFRHVITDELLHVLRADDAHRAPVLMVVYAGAPIGICYEGGLNIRGQPDDTRTEAQKASMRRLLEELHQRYPRAIIIGHHDLNPLKDCPCIKDVVHEYADLQPE